MLQEPDIGIGIRARGWWVKKPLKYSFRTFFVLATVEGPLYNDNMGYNTEDTTVATFITKAYC